MEMRDRLIELISTTTVSIVDGAVSTIGSRFTPSFIKDIADHLLANGVIVPPCKVGDTVWFYDAFMWGLLPCKVDRPYHCVCGEEGGCTFSANFTDDDFGKIVFLTEEEAEKALSRRAYEETK